MKIGDLTIALSVSALILVGAGCAPEGPASIEADAQPAAVQDSESPTKESGIPAPPWGDLDDMPEPTGSGDPNDSICTSKDGTEMTLGAAKELGRASECADLLGEFEGGGMCNYETETWWVTIHPAEGQEKAGCNPACVVDLSSQEAEINWRCTRLRP